MDCRQVDRCLEANLDGRLGGFERVALRQHLRDCRACRAKVDGMRAFAAVMQRTLEVADGPDWTRLAPSPAAAPLRETPAKPYAAPATDPVRSRPSSARTRVRRGSGGRAALTLVVVAGLAVLAVQPLLQDEPRSDAAGVAVLGASAGPTADVLTAAATRRVADRGPDFATGDWATARAWLGSRGLRGLPELDLLHDARLVGVALDHVRGARAAVAVLAGSAGPFDLYLLPPSSQLAEGQGWTESEGLLALAGAWDGWLAVAVAPSDVALPGSVRDRLLAVAGR